MKNIENVDPSVSTNCFVESIQIKNIHIVFYILLHSFLILMIFCYTTAFSGFFRRRADLFTYLLVNPRNFHKPLTRGNLDQKQPLRGVLGKKCSENMQQIYRRTPMPKCNFNKVVSNFIEIALLHGYSPVNLQHMFRTPFPKNTSGWLLL